MKLMNGSNSNFGPVNKGWRRGRNNTNSFSYDNYNDNNEQYYDDNLFIYLKKIRRHIGDLDSEKI